MRETVRYQTKKSFDLAVADSKQKLNDNNCFFININFVTQDDVIKHIMPDSFVFVSVIGSGQKVMVRVVF